MSDAIIAMPEPIDLGRVYQFDIDHIANQMGRDPELWSHTHRSVAGHAIPAFQRELCWTDEMNEAFILSAYYGITLGAYIVTELNYDDWSDPLSNLLLEGQNRLNAVEKYLNDEFKAHGAYFSEISKRDRIRFLRSTFEVRKVKVSSMEEAEFIYKTVNAGIPNFIA